MTECCNAKSGHHCWCPDVVSGVLITDSHRECNGRGCSLCHGTGRASVADGHAVRGTSYGMNQELHFDEVKKRYERYTVDVAAQLTRVAKDMKTSLPIPTKECINDPRYCACPQHFPTPAATSPEGPTEVESCLERMVEGVYRAIGITKLGPDIGKPPVGITSGIALKAFYDAEIEKLTKQIQDSHTAFSTVNRPGDPKRLAGHRLDIDGRRPACEGEQQTAKPGVRYRVYGGMVGHDDVLVVAESEENEGWGRMVKLPGEVFRMLKGRTNAPDGEVALTDDDFETIIHQFHWDPMHFQPWDPVCEDEEAEEIRLEYHELTKDLFFSDLELQAHVAKNADIPFAADAEYGPQWGEKMHAAMEHAWKLATEWGERRKHDVEKACYARSARRAARILNSRRLEEEDAARSTARSIRPGQRAAPAVHLSRMAFGNSYPDPGIEFGSFRVLPRTTGGYIVVDKRRKPGKQQVGAPFKKLEEAAHAAEEWHKAGHG